MEIRNKITQNLYGRLGVNNFEYNYKQKNQNKLNYKLKMNLLTVPLMLDYHLFYNSGFRVSAGLANNNISIYEIPEKPVKFYQDIYYNPNEIDKINATPT